MSAWAQEEIRVSEAGGLIVKREAYVYNHLAIVAPRGGDILFGHWLVIHINSGHAIARIQRSSLSEMKEIVGKIADAGDWSFDGLEGWRNQFPDAPERTAEIIEKHRPDLRRRPSVPPNPVNASAIARLREDELYGDPALPGDRQHHEEKRRVDE